jgi:hypothetical protein
MRKLIRRHMPKNDCAITLALIVFGALLIVNAFTI